MTDPGSPAPGPRRDDRSARSEAAPSATPLPRRTPAATRASWPAPVESAPAPPARHTPSPFRAPPGAAAQPPAPIGVPWPRREQDAERRPAPDLLAADVERRPVPEQRAVHVERRSAPDLLAAYERQPVAVAAAPGEPSPPRGAADVPHRYDPAELPRWNEPAEATRRGDPPYGAEPQLFPPGGDRGRPEPPRPAPPPPPPPPAPQGAVSLGLGRGSRERELVRRVGVPLPGTRKVVVVSIKGGVGKTTTVAVTGSMLAGLRRDKVVALDASSDWGTLAARLSVVPRQSVREMAARGRHAVSESGVLAQLSASPSGLLVVGSDPQSAISAALGEDEYVQAMHLLDYVAGVVVTDVGAGLQQPFLSAALTSCDQLVVASAATWDAAQSAGAALDWLAARGWGHLVEGSLVVMNNLYPARRRRQGFVRDMKADLARRSRAVHEIPFDPALQPGGRILLRKLAASTRQAYLEVAADIMSGLAAATPRR